MGEEHLKNHQAARFKVLRKQLRNLHSRFEAEKWLNSMCEIEITESSGIKFNASASHTKRNESPELQRWGEQDSKEQHNNKYINKLSEPKEDENKEPAMELKNFRCGWREEVVKVITFNLPRVNWS